MNDYLYFQIYSKILRGKYLFKQKILAIKSVELVRNKTSLMYSSVADGILIRVVVPLTTAQYLA